MRIWHNIWTEPFNPFIGWTADQLGSVWQIWRIENLELVPVERQWYGYFYGGDCYLILYTYEVHGKKNYLLYIWQVGLHL